MVPIKGLRKMESSPFISEFNRVLRGLNPNDVRSLRSREPDCILALQACIRNSRKDAYDALSLYTNRKISDEAEWVHDDFLLFAFLCVLIRFGEFRETVEKLVSFRRRCEQSRKLTFLQDAERIAQSEQLVATSMFTVVIADLLERPISDPAVLRHAHQEAVQSALNERVNAFEELIAARCKEVIAELSINSEMSSSVVARNLWKACRFAAAAIYSSCLAVVAIITGWVSWLYFFGSEESSTWAEKLIAVGATGLVFLVWASRERVRVAIAHFFVWAITGAAGYRAMRSLVGGQSEKTIGRMSSP
jgi:hypothetical protein